MDIIINKFGAILTSRKDGKEAFLAIQPRLKDIENDEIINIDFEDVLVLSPSWADEFVVPLKEKYKNKTLFKNTSFNASVKETLELLGEIHGVDF